MQYILIVTKHEIVTMLKKPSFWIMTFLFPGTILLINLITQITTERAFSGQAELTTTGAPVGYVDHAGLIHDQIPGVPEGMILPLEDEARAADLLKAGKIRSYYVIPEDFLETGQVYQVQQELNPIVASQDRTIQYLLTYNLVGDTLMAQRILEPAPMVENISLTTTVRNESDPLGFYLPFGVMFIFFLAITMSSGYLLQSITREKESRTVEVLLVSLNPRQLMLGKILGLSVVALIQLLIWMSGGVLLLERGRQLVASMEGFMLPPGFMIWALLFFIFGFLMYASIMGAIGALAPSMREGAQFTFVVMLPLLLPLWLSNIFYLQPNSTLAVALSLFPLTSPTSMITRMVVTEVPTWQPALALVLLVIAAYFFVSLSARFFRADTLLSTSPLRWRRIALELKRKPSVK
jgi:ABC-2 type transport system permease protein